MRYLGDGLYAECDGHSITLRTRRDGIEHYVVLEPEVLAAFESFVAELRSNAEEARLRALDGK